MAHSLTIPIGLVNSDGKDFSPSTQLEVLLPGYGRESLLWFPDDRLVLQEGVLPVPTRRLLVLLPANDFDEDKLSQRVWNLAAPGALDVLFVILYPAPGAEYFLRKRLALITANTRDRYVNVNSKILPENNWVQAIKDFVRPGDLVVCLEAHRATKWGLFKELVSQELSSSLSAPVYILTGFRLGPLPGYSSGFKEAIFWLVALGIIAGFAFLQILIDQSVTGWLSGLLFMVTVIIEMLLIYLFNQFMR